MEMSNIDLSIAAWTRSSYSNGSGGLCVEVADNLPGVVPVRDSKVPQGAALVLPAAAWSPFVNALKADALRDGRTARWRKSSYSNGSQGDCVEVADNLPGVVPVRDSKLAHSPALVLPAAAWSSFIHALKADCLRA